MTRTFIQKVDLSRYLAHHIVGNNHTQTHRQISGAIVMIVGVLMAQFSAAASSIVIHVGGDVVGFALHAIGLIPYIKTMESGVDKSTDHGTVHETSGDDGSLAAIRSNDSDIGFNSPEDY